MARLGTPGQQRSSWLRRALLQVHLWSGISLSLYILAICVSGSAIVFRREFDKASCPAVPSGCEPHFVTALAEFHDNLTGGRAGMRVNGLGALAVVLICDHRKLDKRGARGAPDWVAEVLSPGTVSHDQITRLAAYERAGVPEVWLVHPADRIVSVYRLEAAHYGRPTILELKGQTSMSAVPNVTIDWDELLADLD